MIRTLMNKLKKNRNPLQSGAKDNDSEPHDSIIYLPSSDEQTVPHPEKEDANSEPAEKLELPLDSENSETPISDAEADPFDTKKQENSNTEEPFSIADHPILSRMRALRYVRVNHSIIFFLYALLGVALLISIKSFVPGVITLYFGVVLVVMGSYFVLNMFPFAGLQLRYDQLGDNLYYLGFIYTLGTLTHSLYLFDGNLKNVYDIISSFGIALSSTVLGVVLRIVAHLMRLDPNEVEDAARTELIDMTSRLRASLDTVVRDMTIFGDQTRQALSELQTDVSQDISGNIEKLVSASNRVLESVDESYKVFTENTSRFNQLSEQSVNAMSALVEKIEAIEAPSNLIEQKLLPATNHIERIAASMNETSMQEKGRVQRLSEVTETMNEVISSVQEQLYLISSSVNQEEISARISEAAGALKDTSEFVVTLREQMKTLTESERDAVTGLRKEYQNSVTNIRTHNINMKEELKNFQSVTSETQDALIELARALKEAL